MVLGDAAMLHAGLQRREEPTARGAVGPSLGPRAGYDLGAHEGAGTTAAPPFATLLCSTLGASAVLVFSWEGGGLTHVAVPGDVWAEAPGSQPSLALTPLRGIGLGALAPLWALLIEALEPMRRVLGVKGGGAGAEHLGEAPSAGPLAAEGPEGRPQPPPNEPATASATPGDPPEPRAPAADARRLSPLEALPPDISTKILSLLGARQLATLRAVSRTVRRASSSEALWERLGRLDFPAAQHVSSSRGLWLPNEALSWEEPEREGESDWCPPRPPAWRRYANLASRQRQQALEAAAFRRARLESAGLGFLRQGGHGLRGPGGAFAAGPRLGSGLYGTGFDPYAPPAWGPFGSRARELAAPPFGDMPAGRRRVSTSPHHPADEVWLAARNLADRSYGY